MKKTVSTVLIMLMLLSSAACGAKKSYILTADGGVSDGGYGYVYHLDSGKAIVVTNPISNWVNYPDINDRASCFTGNDLTAGTTVSSLPQRV